MGGKFFNHAPYSLHTPRMPPHVYRRTRDWYISRLGAHFSWARSPTEAPEKTDHGDVDVTACAERGEPIADLLGHRDKWPDVAALLGQALGAVHAVPERGATFQAHFAVPWKVALGEEDDGHGAAGLPEGKEAYIQLDLTTYVSGPTAEWSIFKHSNGDMVSAGEGGDVMVSGKTVIRGN
jgi:hypothetical protein